ncbi:hypothetical protein E2C01_062590 [Portunus trituberculatus]|uniref:Uncharacterized protein n=1 Tax=Portunus trituberculatus TaxID=210409 RepID=A0A5B7H8A8_PORTR|nr:hypothetical protein [Portunus trituberculatus]
MKGHPKNCNCLVPSPSCLACLPSKLPTLLVILSGVGYSEVREAMGNDGAGEETWRENECVWGSRIWNRRLEKIMDMT